MVAFNASRLVLPATFWISLTMSPICCADSASRMISWLADCASLAVSRTICVVVASWRLISTIELDISSAALAAEVTLVEADADSRTALSTCCEVLPEAPNSARAVVFIVEALSPTVWRMLWICSRNESIAASNVARRSSFRRAAACCCSFRDCSVTSS
jgi:hypothetical protein